MTRRALIASSQIWDGSSMPLRPISKTFFATILAMGSPRVDHPDYNAPPDLQCQFTVEFTNLLRLGNEAFVSLLREFGLKFKGLVGRPHASELLEKGPGLIERLPGVVAVGLRDGSKARTPVTKISKETKRTIGALRQKALHLGIGLGHQR